MKLPERNVNNWKLIEVLPLEEIYSPKYRNHHRLRLFVEKGFTCALCGKVHGKYLGVYKDNGESIHVDVYSEDGTMINRDHIIPKSLGGKDNLDNLQPTCQPCNTKKGNGKSKEFNNQVNAGKRKFKLNALIKFKDGRSSEIFEVLGPAPKSSLLLKKEDGTLFTYSQSKFVRI